MPKLVGIKKVAVFCDLITGAPFVRAFPRGVGDLILGNPPAARRCRSECGLKTCMSNT